MKIFLTFLTIIACLNAVADSSLTKTVNSPVVFSLTVDGTPPFTYQWRKDGVNIAGATAATYNQFAVQPKDAGVYECLITNSAGSTMTDKATLIVSPPVPPVVAPTNGRIKMT